MHGKGRCDLSKDRPLSATVALCICPYTSTNPPQFTSQRRAKLQGKGNVITIVKVGKEHRHQIQYKNRGSVVASYSMEVSG